MGMEDGLYNVNRLRLLREVSLRGTLAAAAEALGYNPSSVSHQLKLLEREVGTRLLEPVGRKVRLTAAAAILVGHAEAILQQLERAEADIALTRHEVAGTVRVATFQTGAHTVVPAALHSLQQLHPELDVRVAHIPVEEALPALLARDYDLVLQEDYPGHPQIAVEGADITSVGLDQLWLLSPKGSKPEGLAALSARNWVMEPSGTLARRWASTVCRSAGFEPRVAYESSDVLLHLRFMAEGLAVALVPGLVLSAMDPAHVQAQALPGSPARRIAVAIRRGSGQSPAIAAVRGALSQAIAERLATS
jgi:DNA-binding transcriptional LysR family regulator